MPGLSIQAQAGEIVLPLVFWWTGIVTMTIGALDYSVFAMNDKLSSLITAYLPAIINDFLFGWKNAGSSFRAAPFKSPTVSAVRNDVMCLTWHNAHQLSRRDKGLRFAERIEV